MNRLISAAAALAVGTVVVLSAQAQTPPAAPATSNVAGTAVPHGAVERHPQPAQRVRRDPADPQAVALVTAVLTGPCVESAALSGPTANAGAPAVPAVED
ncbi:hypothetical protein [Stenotrophomonas sp. GZD-301]|uniref:hypothetical protein n=1 Tax=Stenotrophomonas sp. GZD-301 TaxID=3404814 RepID=UPI003BB7CFC9